MIHSLAGTTAESPTIIGPGVADDIAATLYCHSFPLADCRLRPLDGCRLMLCCNLQQIPRHAFLEIAFELSFEGEIKSFREPVHIVERRGDGIVVAFSFGVDAALKNALQRLQQTVRAAISA